MDVAGRDTVELLEDVLLVFLGDTDAVVLDADFRHPVADRGTHPDVGIVSFVLTGAVVVVALVVVVVAFVVEDVALVVVVVAFVAVVVALVVVTVEVVPISSNVYLKFFLYFSL